MIKKTDDRIRKRIVILLVLCISLSCFNVPAAGRIVKNPGYGARWKKLVHITGKASFDLLNASSIITGWENTTVVAFPVRDRLRLDLNQNMSCRFRLSLGCVVGGEFQAFQVFLNNRKLGISPKAGDKAAKAMLRFETEALPARGNVLTLQPNGNGLVGLFSLKLTPLSFLKSDSSHWREISNGQKCLSATEGYLHLPAGTGAETFFFNPDPRREHVFRIDTTGPVKLFAGDTEIISIVKPGTFHVHVEDKVLASPLTRLRIFGAEKKDAGFRLSVNSPGDNGFFSEVPPEFSCDDSQVEWPSVTLENNTVKATFSLPDRQKGFYRGNRFEHAGMVYSLIYKGEEFAACCSEKRIPVNGKDGAGIAEEFSEPLGFEQARTGGEYLKVGVGIFKKPAWEKYHFWAPSQPVRFFSWQQEKNGDWIRFAQSVKWNGWGYRYVKIFVLDEKQPVLRATYRLENTGEKHIHTSHYSHNFFTVGGVPPGPGYSLRYNTPVDLQPAAMARTDVQHRGAEFLPGKIVKPFFSKLAAAGKGDINSALLFCKDKQLGVQLRVPEYSAYRLRIYMDQRVISPEFFIRISLAPGEIKEWTSEWVLCDSAFVSQDAAAIPLQKHVR